MRVAIISDTHLPRGRRALPQRCVTELRGCDAIVHAGDVMTSAVLDQLRALGPPVHAVYGNVDEPTLREALPERLELDLGGVRLAVKHVPGPAKGRLERFRRWFPDCDAAVFGHTHMPEHQEVDGFQVFNPGSPTERRRAPAHTMGIATVAGGRVTFELLVVG